jgi:hypothetical protein
MQDRVRVASRKEALVTPRALYWETPPRVTGLKTLALARARWLL